MNHLDIPGSVVDLELGGVCSQPLFPGENARAQPANRIQMQQPRMELCVRWMAEGHWNCICARVRYLGMCHSREVE